MPATCPSPRRKAGAAFRPKASPRVCGRSRGVFRNPDSVNSFGFIFLPFTIQHPASAGNSKIFAMRRFWSRNLRLDRLGVNHRYLSVRCHALRRSLALAVDKTPFLPRTGDSFFRKERSKEQFNRLPFRTPRHGVRDLGCAFIAST